MVVRVAVVHRQVVRVAADQFDPLTGDTERVDDEGHVLAQHGLVANVVVPEPSRYADAQLIQPVHDIPPFRMPVASAARADLSRSFTNCLW